LPLAGPTDGHHGSAVIRRHLLANGQPNARTRKLIFAVQPLKNLKDVVHVLIIETNAVVGHIDSVIGRCEPGRLNERG